MNKQNSSLMTADGEVDLVKLVKELWVNKVLILLTTLLALIGSFTYGRSEKDFLNLVKYADPASRVFP
ncbi:Wzz/FepE/Etk N-terminal domain-containing protein [Pseudomonas aeruginosa]|uniref:Wzz/FepE/Etk N-terminal domain-containing protein n=1 Tax=Pseudomonas aeruginosa TaxID=287 RepID=UPI000ACA254E|nr:Wzz/FepE/Etk N-terminal domain-containing protein [Pseudomonas aeruginosa]